MLKELKNYQTLVCSKCDGIGLVGRNKCLECQGRGVVAWLAESRGRDTVKYLLYWGKRIDSLTISQDRVKDIIHKLSRIGLIFAIIVGILSLGLSIYLEIDRIISYGLGYQVIFLIFTAPDWLMLVFWLSLIAPMYILYQIDVDKQQIKEVIKKSYKSQVARENINQSEKVYLGSFEDMKTVGRKNMINISEAFTAEAMMVIKRSWKLAKTINNEKVTPLHLFGELFIFRKIIIIFSRLGVKANDVIDKVFNQLRRTPENQFSTNFSADFRRIMMDAYLAAYNFHQEKVDVDELLLALGGIGDDISNEIFEDFNIDPTKIENVVAWIRIREELYRASRHLSHAGRLVSSKGMDKAMTALQTKFLNAISEDLTRRAKYGGLPLCVGREKEINEIFRIIEGANGSVILVGQPGVGKSSIANGIAEKMIMEDVPAQLYDKRLVSLNISKLISGATAAEAEERLQQVIYEINRAGNVVLFIDNIQDIVGLSSGAEGSLDLSEVLVSALSRQQFICIATAPTYNYLKYIEHNTALGQILKKVTIEEMDRNSSIQVLEAKTGFIEYQNKIYFSYDALSTAVELSDRYMHERFLPAKAIEIIEEVGVYAAAERGKGATVTSEDVAYIVSQKTNIPMNKVTAKESVKLLDLESLIHARMINQVEAVKAVAAALRRAKAKLREENRPIANFLFLGPTGVGKTELAKSVADVYFGAEDNMIRLDMSEYQEKGSINRLIGAPPGFGGGETGGYLTEAVRQKPFSLLLLDEIEKAHPDILNIFLQVMDDGRLTDTTGRTIDFTNTIIIATSNAGTNYIQEQVKAGVDVDEIKKNLLETELKQYFRPEFLNRFDSISVFKPLTPEHIQEITRLMLKKVAKQLAQEGISLQVEETAVRQLAEIGFDPLFGARPLRRVIQEKISDSLANMVLAGKVKRRDTVLVCEVDDIIVKERKKL